MASKYFIQKDMEELTRLAEAGLARVTKEGVEVKCAWPLFSGLV